MLEFLRKHQRYFFAVISVVIIISFSFFGTFNTVNTEYPHEQTVFKAVDGTDVKRHELDDLALFIGTDSHDKMILGGIWGPNFLNDGVIRKDFLETGMGFILASNYPDELLKDLQPRSEKEKRYNLYSHPQANFINVESAWSYFAPDMKANYETLRYAGNPVDAENLAARISLFLQEKQFPAPLLRQVLEYQEKQYAWLPPDESLYYQDLSLFGYHTTEDWFGPRFVRLVAQFIMNGAKVAEQKGYKVTKEEALADLMQQAAASYQQNINNPNLGVANLQQYFEEQLRRMNMDQNKAAKIWREVLLYRRLFNDVGQAVVVDPFSIEKIQGYTQEGVVGELYQLPKDLRFDNYRNMQKLETYLNAVAKRDEKNLLDLPSKFLSLEEVSKKYPELIQTRYILEVAQLNKSTLQTKVGVKETWNWEVEDSNWASLTKKFPDLAMKKSTTREERFAALDALDDKTRAQVDAFARAAIVDKHPEWVQQALEAAPAKVSAMAILDKGGKTPLAKGEKRQELMKLLNKASLKGENLNAEAQQLQLYTPDELTYYRISVVERAPKSEIMTFAEADQQGVLDELLDKNLEVEYVKVREEDASQYKKPDGSWKSLADVKDLIADQYFAKIRQAIEKDYTQAIAPQAAPSVFLGDFLASLRLYAYMRHVKESMEKTGQVESWVLVNPEAASDKLASRVALEDQWKLLQTPYQGTRSDLNKDLNAHDVFAMNVGDWGKVQTPGNGNLNFFHLEKRQKAPTVATSEKVGQLYQVASMDAQRIYMQKLLYELKDKKALSLDYMNKSVEPQ